MSQRTGRYIPGAPNVFTLGFLFDAAKDGTNVNFFKESAPAGCTYEVMVNSMPTTQAYNAVTFKKGDYILIRLIEGDKYPWFDASQGSYIAKVTMPLPTMSKADGTPVTDITGCFSDNADLTSVVTELFDNNQQLTTLDNCFLGCSSLTVGTRVDEVPVMPEDGEMPAEVATLDETPTEILETMIGLNIPDGVTSAKGFAENTKSVGTVYVHTETTTATTFAADKSVNVNAVEMSA